MKKRLFAAATGALLVAAVPASAQLYFDAAAAGYAIGANHRGASSG